MPNPGKTPASHPDSKHPRPVTGTAHHTRAPRKLAERQHENARNPRPRPQTKAREHRPGGVATSRATPRNASGKRAREQRKGASEEGRSRSYHGERRARGAGGRAGAAIRRRRHPSRPAALQHCPGGGSGSSWQRRIGGERRRGSVGRLAARRASLYSLSLSTHTQKRRGRRGEGGRH